MPNASDNSIPVIASHLNGELIGEYESIARAKNALLLPRTLNGNRHTKGRNFDKGIQSFSRKLNCLIFLKAKK